MSSLDSLSYLIDDYIYSNQTDPLYSYVDYYMSLVEALPDDLQLKNEYKVMSERIEKKLVGLDTILEFNTEIDFLFYNYNFTDNYISINNNLIQFCKEWDRIFNKQKEQKLLTVIVPAQTRFLERLFNPYKNIGYNFAQKKMNELPWVMN